MKDKIQKIIDSLLAGGSAEQAAHALRDLLAKEDDQKKEEKHKEPESRKPKK
jgi:hypothetical protein